MLANCTPRISKKGYGSNSSLERQLSTKLDKAIKIDKNNNKKYNIIKIKLSFWVIILVMNSIFKAFWGFNKNSIFKG